MRHPEGFVDQSRPEYFWKLKRALYGLRQAACGFYEALNASLQDCRLSPLRTDPAVFLAKSMTTKRGLWPT